MSDNNTQRSYIPFWMNWIEFIQEAPDSDKLSYLKSIIDYALTGEEPDKMSMTPTVRLVWPATKSRMDKDRNIYTRNANNSRNAGAPRTKDLVKTEIIEAWNEASFEGRVIISDVSEFGWELLCVAWKDITSLSRFKKIVFNATKYIDLDRTDPVVDLFGHRDYMGILSYF